MASVHTTFESYDDEFQKRNPIQKKELKNLAALNFGDKFSKGSYMNKNHGDLQTAIINTRDEDNKLSMYEAIASLVERRFKNVPFVREKTFNDIGKQKLIFNLDRPLGFIKYQKFKAQMTLVITYHLKEVDYMEIEKGTYSVHFSTRITRDATSYSPASNEDDKETARMLGILYGEGDTLSYDVIQRALYGTPNPEDKEFAENNTISKNNLDFNRLSVLMNKVLFNANLFKGYCAEHYDINIF